MLKVPLESEYPSLIHTLKEAIPPIVAVDATILYPQHEQRYTKHNIILLAITTRKVVYHDPTVGPNQSTMPAIFKKAWHRTENEVIFI